MTLEGLALTGNPDYGLVMEAYPFVARKLLRSPSPLTRHAHDKPQAPQVRLQLGPRPGPGLGGPRRSLWTLAAEAWEPPPEGRGAKQQAWAKASTARARHRQALHHSAAQARHAPPRPPESAHRLQAAPARRRASRPAPAPAAARLGLDRGCPAPRDALACRPERDGLVPRTGSTCGLSVV